MPFLTVGLYIAALVPEQPSRGVAMAFYWTAPFLLVHGFLGAFKIQIGVWFRNWLRAR